MRFLKKRIEEVKPTDTIVSEYKGEVVSFKLTVKPEFLGFHSSKSVSAKMFWKQYIYTDVTETPCMLYIETGKIVNVLFEN